MPHHPDGPAHELTGTRRLRLEVGGAVQGVGFRPFLYRAATERGLSGWIRNDPRGVTVELEGEERDLQAFLGHVRTAPPPRAVIQEMHEAWLPAAGLQGLAIVPSEDGGDRLAAVLPDIATCQACLADIGVLPAPATDRRRDYPFTNCTDCGPRFSIIRALPYDRPNTTMASFRLCAACRAEYEDPLDRRFHAQPTACPACGPRLRLGPGRGVDAAELAATPADGSPLVAAVLALRGGLIVAVKGLGGFHLMVAAGDEAAVARLRERKRRPTRPFAVMVPDLAAARAVCHVSDGEAELLASPEAPIVLARRLHASRLAEGVAPGNPYVGLMLPYTPLHHLLMRALGAPVVATSGNLSDEPICSDDAEAADRLGSIADLFLFHDRPIERPVDDSVVQWSGGAPALLRRSRGYAPLPVRLGVPVPPILAVGGHLKNTIALARGPDVFLSQHIGDLETVEARAAFERVIEDFLRLYEVEPVATAHDLHPDYASTAWASSAGFGQRVAVQHHHAHLAACLADNDVAGPALGVVWDGTGLGTDGTVWGGEFLLGDAGGYRRVAHLRPFRLPGGEAAVREPRRVALALLHEAAGASAPELLHRGPVGAAYQEAELRVLERTLETGFNAPWTTSAGRLFDGIASLLGLRQRVHFEGEAAMALEYAAASVPASDGYEIPIVAVAGEPLVVDWAPALLALLTELEAGARPELLAGRFHAGLAAAIANVGARVGEERVALTGGCFQNRVLVEGAVAALRARGLRPILHRRVPTNDGGLSLGQVAVAAATLARG
jgi:hydrogenase maturation protein HypF